MHCGAAEARSRVPEASLRDNGAGWAPARVRLASSLGQIHPLEGGDYSFRSIRRECVRDGV